MKDVTSTSFGLLIGHLLPGLGALIALSFWSTRLTRLFQAFMTSESSVGLFLTTILVALMVGLELSLIRWLLFERWLFRSRGLDGGSFSRLGVESRLVSFKAAVEESYRYHQFWGSMVFVIPLFFFGWLLDSACGSTPKLVLWALLFLGVECATFLGAADSLGKYFERGNAILKGENDGQRMGT